MSALRAPAWLATLACALSLAACAPARQIPTVSPEQLFTIQGINVRAPNSAGWVLADRSDRAVSFAKKSREPGETLAAQVLTFELPRTETPAQFEQVIREHISKNWNPKRFELVNMSNEPSKERGYPCVHSRSTFYDMQARVSPTAIEKLLFEIDALYCRHPRRADAGFAAVYSHRGRSAYPPLASEAADYRKRVEVP